MRSRHNAGYTDKLLLPAWAEVVKITPEAEGVTTFALKFTDPGVQQRYRWEPGQFNMLYVPGYGEAAISMSSDVESSDGLVIHTIRHVGNVTKATSRLKVGDVVGLRGPFGSAWPLEGGQGMDVVIACGGIGLPPLRGALYSIMRNREKYGKVTLLYGARTPKDLMYPNEYEAWKKAGIEVQVTVDRGDETWTGRVGVVPIAVLPLPRRPAQDRRADLRSGDHDPLRHLRSPGAAHPHRAHLRFARTQHEMRPGRLRTLPDGSLLHLQGRAGLPVRPPGTLLQRGGVLMTLTPKTTQNKPKVAVYKFSSCDGCQLSLLNLEDELLDLASAVDIAYFLEATRAVKPGPYDIGIVEGSITTPHEAERIKDVRSECKYLIALGTCATAGGIQALRNFAKAEDYAEDCLRASGVSELPGEIHFHRRECAGRPGHLGLPGQQIPGGRSDRGPAAEPTPELPAQPGLPGMQTQRHRLRGGGPGHPLPGTGRARRLRGAMPRQWTRLLRLLRPVQRSQFQCTGGRYGPARPLPERDRRPAAQLQQRHAPAFQTRLSRRSNLTARERRSS